MNIHQIFGGHTTIPQINKQTNPWGHTQYKHIEAPLWVDSELRAWIQISAE